MLCSARLATNQHEAREGLLLETTRYSLLAPIMHFRLGTRENVNDLIANTKIAGEIDLLSLDVYGFDYWLWENFNVIRPHRDFRV
jgi:hypothetical protein